MRPGTRLGPYEILAAMGAGGMGEVFRARDTRLDRQVAIKVLGSTWAGNEELGRRFQREAKAISALNHPHICTLFDVGECQPEVPEEEDAEPGVRAPVAYLVMELLEGESLAQRLRSGPLPIEEVLRFGGQIARALEAAHRRGIVHRDLKPANVVLTASGAKLLDFGLAKAIATQVPPGAATSAATDALPLTERGTIVGTFQYIAPEQLAGQEASPRSDLWALGCLLYEMSTGRRPFDGSSRASLMGAIVAGRPAPPASLRPNLPASLGHLIDGCLEKDPGERWQSAHDVALELDWISRAGSGSAVAPPATRARLPAPLAWALAALLAAGVVASAWSYLGAGARTVPTVSAAILAPQATTLQPSLGFALSPDGTRLAFVAEDEQQRQMLWIRPLGSSAAQPLPGTEAAAAPFWSPDGRHLGFFADGRLKRIAAHGGPAQVLAPARGGRGGSWGRDGSILFAPGFDSAIFRVADTGGSPVVVTRLDREAGEQSHRWPSILPDGKHFLYTAERRLMLQERAESPGDDPSAIRLASLDGKIDREILPTRVTSAVYAPPGYLLLWKDDTLVAQAFDLRRMRPVGDLLLVAPHLQRSVRWQSLISVSDNGVLVYYQGKASDQSRLAFFDRSGQLLETVASQGVHVQPRLSSDGTRIAVEVIDVVTSINDLWVHDLGRGSSVRLTASPSRDSAPVWSPDDRRIAFASSATSPSDVVVRDSSGIGAPVSLTADPHLTIPMDWSRDGERLFFQRMSSEQQGWQIGFLSPATGEETIVLESRDFLLLNPQVSPDGRWLLYESGESGRSEVYLSPLEGEAGKWPISTGGGSHPRWRGDGGEIFYLAPGFHLMAVEFVADPETTIGLPTPLFAMPVSRLPGYQYDVTRDGQRFLVNGAHPQSEPPHFTLLQDWAAGRFLDP